MKRIAYSAAIAVFLIYGAASAVAQFYPGIFACPTHQWISSFLVGGQPACTQPAATDISGLAPSATTDTTNATNITSGTLPPARLGANGVANSQLAQATANTVKGNVTGSLANETDVAVPGCSGATQALNYTSGTGFGCPTFGTVVAQNYVATTWTPTLQGSSTAGAPSYSIQVGSYEQIGRHITVRFFIVTTALGSPTGNMQIGGLPITSANTTNDVGSCFISAMAGVTLDASYVTLTGAIAINSNVIALEENGSGQSNQNAGVARFAAATTVQGVCEYHS